jgi:ABC-type microcin C transport system duplicated ATPase subunit YejF
MTDGRSLYGRLGSQILTGTRLSPIQRLKVQPRKRHFQIIGRLGFSHIDPRLIVGSQIFPALEAHTRHIFKYICII